MRRAILQLLFVALSPGCGHTPAQGPTDTAEASDESPAVDVSVESGNFYEVTIAYPDGLQQKYTRDLDEVSGTAFAFGSQHIGSAVSLAIEDTLFSPFASINFNFGFVVGSNDYPVTITGDDAWPWGTGVINSPPSFKITAKDGKNIQRTFISWAEGASGTYLITAWGTEPGDLITGAIEGTLVSDTDPPLEAVMKGKFQFFLPSKSQGQ